MHSRWSSLALSLTVLASLLASLALAGCTSFLGDFNVGESDASFPDASLEAGGGDAGADGTVTGETGAPPDAATTDAEAGPGEDGATADACTPETDAQLCARARKDCDGFVTTDACGVSRLVKSCGACTAPQTCGAVTPNTCGCNTETDADFCRRLGKNCGPLTDVDVCGVTRSVASCGACTSPQTCGAQLANVCGSPICTPESDTEFCKRFGASCGTIANTDSCGKARTVSCGTCTAPLTCNASFTCTCTYEGDAALCASKGKTCGTVTLTDHCDADHTVTCGTCNLPQTCSATNVCVCIPETDAQLCKDLGKACGATSGKDNCGTTRSVPTLRRVHRAAGLRLGRVLHQRDRRAGVRATGALVRPANGLGQLRRDAQHRQLRDVHRRQHVRPERRLRVRRVRRMHRRADLLQRQAPQDLELRPQQLRRLREAMQHDGGRVDLQGVHVRLRREHGRLVQGAVQLPGHAAELQRLGTRARWGWAAAIGLGNSCDPRCPTTG